MNENYLLKKWYLDFITEFRKETAKLSTDERKFIQPSTNFKKPLQIEIFWLEYPTLQVSIITHLKDRKDLEIIVNGPFSSHEFYESTAKILNEKRWQRISHARLKKTTAGNLMAEDIFNATNNLLFYMFSPQDVVNGEKNLLAMSGYSCNALGLDWIQIAHWNVAENNPKEMVAKLIQNVKNTAKQKSWTPSDSTSESNRYMQSCLATHIYPPVFIGKIKELDIHQKIRGQRRAWPSWNRIFQVKVENTKIIFENDGFVTVITSEKNLGMKILNLIFGILIIYGYQIYSVREFDLLEGTMNTKTKQIGSWRGPLNPVRESLIRYRMGMSPQDDFRDKIKICDLKDSTYVAKMIFQDPLAEDLRFLSEAYTNFYETQYGQSFMLSWMIIERVFYRMWKGWLETKSDNHTLKIPQLQFDKTLEFLKSVGKINNSDYVKLSEIRRQRNDFAHGKVLVDVKSSKICLDFAIDLIKKQLTTKKFSVKQ